ncbi:ABC transporter type 1 transmembrane domain superfamily [Arabidopsis thaliana x Arabidopsis arenosa]|uniref:ABC transporter type 1 transmembrane domain superfamily n=1 Tax=Arabidopsis thaliana x Arabidopsis arenosa TaxID=1240361 RepID=A0A8T2BZE1_9BRAS|nr:ABC transporter type 1 transmembrane domain superfamily [Arabidopsis thaliana x Arabidopsis arenosa]
MDNTEERSSNGNIQAETEAVEEKKKMKKESVSLMGLFSAADKLDYFLMLLGGLGACIHGATLPLFFVFFGKMLDSLGNLSTDPKDISSRVSQNALYLVYLGLVNLVSAWIGVACWMQTGERQTARLRINYLKSILAKDITFFDTEARDSNLIFHISSDAILVQDAIGDKTDHVLRYLSQFIAGFVIGFLSVWQLTLLTLAVVPLIAVAGGGYAIIMSTISEKSETAYADAGKVAEEVMSQVRTVYAFVGEEKAVKSYSNSLKKALKLGKRSGLAKGLGVGLTYSLLFCSWALLLWYASLLVRHGKTNGAKAFTTILNVIFSGFALGQAAPSLSAITKGRVAAANIFRMIGNNNLESSERLENGTTLQNVAGRIEFHQVSFAYPSRPNMVFENLSFTIRSGKTFAFVGPSGSGKSTIISMVQRFYEPNSGKILLDGNDIKSLKLKWLREHLGLVSQEPALFATTIASNIIFGKENANMDQIIEAAKAANADSFIKSLPNGYNTQVGEGGTQLSGGQKQRIAIARAVLRNPKILLLDEATSALDAESEKIVQQALDNVTEKRTTIVVAHRLSTIRNVDKIVVLRNGQVTETGSHSELMSRGGDYATLVNCQETEPRENSRSIMSETCKSQAGSSSSRRISSSRRTSSFREDQEKTESDSNDKDFSSSSMIWELVKLNSPEWPYALLGSIGAVLAGAQTPLFSMGIAYVLTAFYSPFPNAIKRDVEKVAILFVGAGIVTAPIYLLQHYFYTLMGERLTSRVRLSLFSAILSNEIGWFDLDENNTGSLTSILAADATLVRSALADRLSTIVQNMSLTVTALALAFFYSWRVAAVVTACFPLLIAASLTEQLFLKGFGGDYTRAYSRATSVAREAIANIRTVAAFGAEKQISEQFTCELSKPTKNAFVRGHISGFGYGLSQFLAFCSYALGLWYVSVSIKHKETNFGDSIKSFMVLIVTAFSVSETLALTPDIVKGTQALGSVFRVLHRETEIPPDQPNSRMVSQIKGDIEFRNVSFVYPTRPDINIFQNLNLRVSAGKSLAVVGPSGSGKSTVIGLIMRFYDPSHGNLCIDGQDLKTLNLRSLRKKLALVQQEPALFSTTIHENIKYGNENASESEIIEAAKAANAHEFISRMEEGYKTYVGDKGVQLSGGQKQRVAIARAVLKDPSVLLLDEATSALDTSSEKLVQEALDKLMKGRTTVLVAHRLSTIRKADTIAVLHKGRVVEKGSHRELVSIPNGFYKQLTNLQEVV